MITDIYIKQEFNLTDEVLKTLNLTSAAAECRHTTVFDEVERVAILTAETVKSSKFGTTKEHFISSLNCCETICILTYLELSSFQIQEAGVMQDSNPKKGYHETRQGQDNSIKTFKQIEHIRKAHTDYLNSKTKERKRILQISKRGLDGEMASLFSHLSLSQEYALSKGLARSLKNIKSYAS